MITIQHQTTDALLLAQLKQMDIALIQLIFQAFVMYVEMVFENRQKDAMMEIKGTLLDVIKTVYRLLALIIVLEDLQPVLTYV